tara:strand:+ start:1106 stop:1942 length:837 start_codon:yes stop_codon:yes gene_type:complete
MRDRQRQKVYDWENKASWSGKSTNELNEQQCLFIINSLNKIYADMRVETKFVNGDRRYATCASYVVNHVIKLPREWALCWSVVLHEYAHALSSDRKYKKLRNRAIEPHGKEFVTAFCVLLHKFHPDQPSYKELSQSLRDDNIDFEHMESSKLHKQIGRKTIKLTKAKENKDYDFTTSLLKLSVEGRRRTAAGDGHYKPKTKMNRVLCVLDYSIIFLYRDKPITCTQLESSFKKLPVVNDHYNKLIHKVIDDHGKLELSLIKYMIKEGLIVATSTQNKG